MLNLKLQRKIQHAGYILHKLAIEKWDTDTDSDESEDADLAV